MLSRLHEGLTTFKQEIVRDVIASRRLQVAVITFNDGARLSQGFAPINLHIPLQLNAEGATAMGQGLTLMLNELQALEARYHSNNVNFHTPWVFLIIGSRPTDSWEQAAQRVRDAVEAKQLNFFVVGIRGADMMMLRQVAHPSQSPIMIDGLKFQEMFHWLADSMKQVACSDVGSAVDLSPTTGWARVS